LVNFHTNNSNLWVYFGGPCNWKCWYILSMSDWNVFWLFGTYILWTFGNFIVIWYSFPPFGI
jgi:hypothetical protein